MATDGDKIAAATLAAELLRRGITAHSIENAADLYAELLRRTERISASPAADASASGTALTNDSFRLADMRVWLDEERNRGPVWSGRP